MKILNRLCVRRIFQVLAGALMAAALLLPCVLPAAAQKDKKKKKDGSTSDSATPIIPLGDQQAIDYLISEMLGAWQVGDTEKLHKNYADDVSVVSGIWTPPIFGWSNYLASYQVQRGRMRQVRLERTNTYIKANGNFAWASYQWEFDGVVDGQATPARGQTTLVLEKRNNRWLIVHNHTSIVQGGPAPTSPQANPANTPPTAPPEAAKPPAR